MDLTDLLGGLSPQHPDQGPGQDGRPAAVEAQRAVCSRRGCTREALFRLEWNNPRVHAPDRRKVWLACGEHRDWLAQYLSARGFLRRVLPLTE